MTHLKNTCNKKLYCNNQSLEVGCDIIELYLITGFLGSGKTTCINNLLNRYKNEKIGIIVNEFGSESIDGKLIKYNGVNMCELSNGSIFCQCIKDDFITALGDFLDFDISILFIEASGLADHSNIRTILNTIEKVKGKAYDYVGSICIVDAVYFLQQVDLLPVLGRQVQYSNIIVVNKIDLQTQDEINKIEEKIVSLNQNAIIIKTMYCNFDIPEALNKLTDVDLADEESTNTVFSRPQSFVITIESNSDYENTCKFIKEIMVSAYRIKGFIKTNLGVYQVSCVNEIFEINKYNEYINKYNLVVISRLGIKIISLITKLSRKYGLKISID